MLSSYIYGMIKLISCVRKGETMELLSPAGDFESLKTAVKCGADAVYVGGPFFSARKNAKNFTKEELVKALNFCHLRGVKLYVACNILIKEAEMPLVLSYAKWLIEIGTDGIIVQDLGLFSAISKMSEEIKINASTQMTVCSADGVNLLEELGADRVVLARELSETEIKSIRQKTNLELEVFVHGALCISWSGQCLMSSIIGGRSGNRGACAQPCRLPYTLYQDGKAVTKTAPLLSTKDLCLAQEMDRVCAISDSAKIEGRMKSAEYAGSVTKVYKSAIERKANQEEISDMLSFFSRGGSCLGYFKERAFGEMMEKGETGKISASKESAVKIKQAEYEKKRNISFTLIAKTGEPLLLCATCDGFSSEAKGEALEAAKSGVFDKERMEAQLKKLGDTPFAAENIDIITEGTPFISVSVLNGMRRSVCEDIAQKICASYQRTAKEIACAQEKAKRKKRKPKLCVQVRTKEQLEVARKLGVDELYLAGDLEGEGGTKDSVLVLPPVTKEGETLFFGKAERVLVQNIGQIPKAKGKTLYGGERLNITNNRTVALLGDMGFSRVTLSPELNFKELKQVADATEKEIEIIAYGRLPVMLVENCIIKSHYRCTNKNGVFELADRKNERFPILCEGCRNVVLNSVPLYMADKMEDILNINPDAIRLMLTIESGEETKKVIAAYQKALAGEVPESVFDKITRGHFYRGVE